MISIRKLWDVISQRHDALCNERNFGESFEALCDLIQYLDEYESYDEEDLIDLIKEAHISLKEVQE